MKRPADGIGIVLTMSFVMLIFLLVLYRFGGRLSDSLPYEDKFASGIADEWTAFGGTWELVGGLMQNRSDERGAKLLTGSDHWTNYSIEADVMLLGLGGDAGLVIRSSHEEQGVDAYTGYYAGIRTVDDMIVLGRAEHGWMEASENLQPRGFKALPSRWYHLKLLAFECQVVATVSMPPDAAQTTIGIKDQNCIGAGRAGLRSYASGGSWRNVSVHEATADDLEVMLAKARPQPPSQSRQDGVPDRGSWGFYGTHGQRELPSDEPPSVPGAQLISALHFPSSSTFGPVTVRGITTLASPSVFVQDSTGGIEVQLSKPESLKVGDEVEMTGVIGARDGAPILRSSTPHVLWEGSPTPPVSVTASQAATEQYEATFVEVEGTLSKKEAGPVDELIFTLDAGPQSFRAIMNRGRSDLLYRKLDTGSLLRVRGICVSNPSHTLGLVPFGLLVRSNEDITLVAGPPWWSAGHVVAIVLSLLFLSLIGTHLYHRVESWRLRAVLEERERLAFEMHDTLSQSFAGIGFQLEAIRATAGTQVPKLNEQVELARELVRHSHEETRRSIAVLRPEKPGTADLLSVLTESANRLVEGGAVKVVATSSGDLSKIPLRIADSFFRIGQEALANSVRHAEPSSLNISVDYDKSAVMMRISDDGRGFFEDQVASGFGLKSMRKRASAISALLRLDSSPGHGTTIRVSTATAERKTIVSWWASRIKQRGVIEDVTAVGK